MNCKDEETKAEALVLEILQYACSQLRMSFRFLDLALSRLKPVANELFPLATDGISLYYQPGHVFALYRAEGSELNRAYLHSVFHCVFYHPFVHADVDRPLWDLASDVAVEAVIQELGTEKLRCARSSAIREELEGLKKRCSRLSAERLYREFKKENIPEEERERLARIFSVDSHRPWYVDTGSGGGEGEGEGAGPKEVLAVEDEKQQPGEGGACEEGEEQQAMLLCPEGEPEDSRGSTDDSSHSFFRSSQLQQKAKAKENWEQISQRMQVDLDTSSLSWGERSESLRQNVREVNREVYDYADFLRKFSVLGEEMQINDEEFDYIFYTYGLQLYENVPLIEPVEYKEVRRVRDFVIAIDTSASVQGEQVQKFVTKTYNILSQQENFFTKINVHILQCDTQIQQAVKLTCREDFEHYLRNMELHGFGGTDFRPVFRYVEELLEQGEFQNLKGLLYFTDGCGTFPERRPDYETAFVFVEEPPASLKIPPWAIRLVLDEE